MLRCVDCCRGTCSWAYQLTRRDQLYVIPFYEKNGYRRVGEEFDEDGGRSYKERHDRELTNARSAAPHVKMVCPLS